MLEELTKLNHSDKFCVAEYYPVKFRGTANPKNLVLPEGYYYSQKYGITNRAHTLYVKSSTYEYFEYEWDSVMSKVQDNIDAVRSMIGCRIVFTAGFFPLLLFPLSVSGICPFP